ncbi:unnamed protein product [Sympodiomycopsis kandeliae]
MGKAAKMYKRPTLKQKEAKKKSSSSSATTDTQTTGASLAELKRQAIEQKRLIELEKMKAEKEQVETQDPEARKKRSPRVKKRFKVAPGEAKTPKEAGIDYVAQFEGKKNFRS